jgi:hypothetical protein
MKKEKMLVAEIVKYLFSKSFNIIARYIFLGVTDNREM